MSQDSILAAIIIASKSDWDTMRPAAEVLTDFDVPHDCKILSAHRTPKQLTDYVSDAESRGCEVFIAGAGGAAHLAGVIAAHTLRPVLGVPVESVLQGLDSLLSTVQMPGGIPVGTMAIGRAGATNAGLMAAAILGASRPEFLDKIAEYRAARADKILNQSLPSKSKKAGFK